MTVEINSQQNYALYLLRDRLIAEYGKNADDFNERATPADVVMVKSEDWLLLLFLRRFNFDVDVTFPAVVDCLKWRHEFGIERLSMQVLRPNQDRMVVCFSGVDKNNHAILWFNTRYHKRGDPEEQKSLVYLLERYVMKTRGKPIVIIFDMTGSGLQNIDLNAVRFLLDMLKFYYPSVLSYLLVYDIPFLLNAAWKIIRSWLEPDAQKLIIFVGKNSINKYVGADNLPLHMGGTDDFVFSFDPMMLDPSHKRTSIPDDDRQPLVLSYECPTNNFAVVGTDYCQFFRAHLQKNGNVSTESCRSDDETGRLTTSLNGYLPDGRFDRFQGRLSGKLREIVDNRLNQTGDGWFEGPILDICPKDELQLRPLSDVNSDRVEVVVLRNSSAKNVVFKIKTTAPEKFRVRPSVGVIVAGTTEVVKLYLQTGYTGEAIARDKFLVMAMATTETTDNLIESNGNLADRWIESSDCDRQEHRLRCRLIDNEFRPVKSPVKLPPSSQVQIDNLVGEIRAVRAENRLLLLLFAVIVLILVFTMVQYHSSVYRSLVESLDSTLKDRHIMHDSDL